MGIEKNTSEIQEEELGSRALIILCFQKNHAQIFNLTIDVFAAETEENDERTAKAFAVFQRSIRMGMHHEFFGELDLCMTCVCFSFLRIWKRQSIMYTRRTHLQLFFMG